MSELIGAPLERAAGTQREPSNPAYWSAELTNADRAKLIEDTVRRIRADYTRWRRELERNAEMYNEYMGARILEAR